MANINIESTLQGIRKGAASPGVPGTLADQIRNKRMQEQKQEAAIKKSLQEMMLNRQKEKRLQIEGARKATQARQEQSAKRMFGMAQQLTTMAQKDPQGFQQWAQQNPQRAQRFGIDPQNPNPNQIVSFRDRMRAQIEGDVPDAPREEKEPSVIRTVRSMGYDPETPEGRAMIQDLKRGVDVNLPESEKAYAKTIGEGMGETQVEAMQSGINASEEIRDMETLESSLLAVEEGGFKTGTLGELRQMASQAFEYLNIDPGIANLGSATTSEIIDSMSGNLSVKLAENLDRATNLQFKTVKRAVPNLGKTVQGNLILTNLLKKDAQRKQGRGKIASAFINNSDNGTKLNNSVTVNGITLKEGTTYQEALAKYEQSFEQMDEATQNYIEKASNYEKALVAPTSEDGETIDTDSMKEGQTYLMPDSKVIEYKGNGEAEIIEDLNADSD